MVQGSSNTQEQRLAERLRLGDSEAMRELYALYGGYLTAVGTRYLANKDDVKDVLQEAMVRVFTRIGSFHYRGQGSLRSWVARIVVNASLNMLREKHRMEFTTLEDNLVEEDEDEEADDPPISDVPPDELQQMISRLPAGYRAVFCLYVMEDKSHREIADMLGIGERTSSSQLSRAKNLLAKMIRQYHQQQKSQR